MPASARRRLSVAGAVAATVLVASAVAFAVVTVSEADGGIEAPTAAAPRGDPLSPALNAEPLTGMSICRRSSSDPPDPCFTFDAEKADELAAALQADAVEGPGDRSTPCSAIGGPVYVLAPLPPGTGATVIEAMVHPFHAGGCSTSTLDGADVTFSGEALLLVHETYDMAWRKGTGVPTAPDTCAAVARTGSGATASVAGGETVELQMAVGDDVVLLQGGVCDDRLEVTPQQTGAPVLVTAPGDEPSYRLPPPDYQALRPGTVDVALPYRRCEGLTRAPRTTCVDGLQTVGTLRIDVTG